MQSFAVSLTSCVSEPFAPEENEQPESIQLMSFNTQTGETGIVSLEKDALRPLSIEKSGNSSSANGHFNVENPSIPGTSS